MAAVPDSHKDLLQSKAVAMLATINPDGTPQVTPVWFDWDGEHLIFNTARGRQKDANLTRNPHVALAIVDPQNLYRYLQVRGVVVEATEEGANESIDKLAFKYLGQEKYPFGQPGEVRVLYRVRPDRVQTMG